jgi:hypothetical protein
MNNNIKGKALLTSERILNFLNNSPQGTLLLAPAIILMIIFWM